jgi:hypothetical protein
MALEDHLLLQARDASDRLARSQQAMDDARTDYHQAIRRLHLAGGSLRDIAEAIEVSYQRVHQIIQGTGGLPDGRRKKAADLTRSFCGASSGALVAGAAGRMCVSCVDFCDEVISTVIPS